MAKELPYFKFEPAEWMMGRITRESSNVQIAFIRICCQFWRNSGDMTIEDAALECEENEFNILIKKKFILTSGNCISIKFLDIQLDEMAEVSKGRSKAAKARWDKKNAIAMQTDANALQLHNHALQNDADKIREDKKREEDTNMFISFSKSLKSLGAEDKLVKDWLKVRKTKKATNTETAFEGFKTQLEKSGKGVNEILTLCVEKSWSGFNSEWVGKELKETNLEGKYGAKM